MRHVFLITLLCTMFYAFASAQDNYLSDKERIALTPIVLDDNIPSGAYKQLENKMTQIAAKSGCAAIGNSRFIITCSVDILTKDITPTAPPQHAYTIALHFYVGDGVEGRLFSSHTIETKGVGTTPDKAYINALKNVRVNDPAFKAMMDQGKKEIIAYYKTYCTMIITDAESMVKYHQYSNAIDLLNSVPMVCEECYRHAQNEILVIYKAWSDEICLTALNKAQTAWSIGDVKAATEALAFIPTDGSCIQDAENLKKEIADKLNTEQRQEWEFKMQHDKEQQDVQERQQWFQTATDAVAVYQEESTQIIIYQVKGNWFQ